MEHQLAYDKKYLDILLQYSAEVAQNFLANIDERPTAISPKSHQPLSLPEKGMGGEEGLALFMERYEQELSGSAGARYWGFVTGGSTPASVMGDWLASAIDQNITQSEESIAQFIEAETIKMLRELFGLPSEFFGTFVSGATMSNFTGLAIARQWLAHHYDINLAQDGFAKMPPVHILSALPHSSTYKSLAMLGFGRRNVQIIPTLDRREAIDIAALEQALEAIAPAPSIVIASAGTVNTVDFDDLQAIAKLKERYNFWLHVDAAFGGFAAVSPRFQHLMAGIEHADSITIDAHKWLNVPYDSAMQFTRHRELQLEVFQNSAAYLGDIGDNPNYVHYTPQNSRRFRALPAWMSLMAYGRDGYRDIVERNCEITTDLGELVTQSDYFRLLAPVRMNVVCFTLANAENTPPTLEMIQDYLAKLHAEGLVFMTQTVYEGVPGIRAAISNWRTDEHDLQIAWQSLTATASNLATVSVA